MKQKIFRVIICLMIFSTVSMFKLFASTCPATVQDIEGNTYDVVKIGEQCWMAENLATTEYNDGTDIPNVDDTGVWNNLDHDAYCWFNNDYDNYGSVYGALYNFFAVETGKLCPDGWKVPSDEEWKELEMYLGMTQAQADSAMWRGTTEGLKIKHPSIDGTNETGFSALGAGWLVWNLFSSYGRHAYFWTSTEKNATHAYQRLVHDATGVGDHRLICRSTQTQDMRKQAGQSVRCIKE